MSHWLVDPKLDMRIEKDLGRILGCNFSPNFYTSTNLLIINPLLVYLLLKNHPPANMIGKNQEDRKAITEVAPV